MKGTLYSNRPDDEVVEAIREAAETVYGVPFKKRWRPLAWFRRYLRRGI